MSISATKLRQNLYRILDKVIETGVPVEIDRKGKVLKIIPAKPVKKIDRLEPHDTVIGDPEDIVKDNWSEYWNEGNIV